MLVGWVFFNIQYTQFKIFIAWHLLNIVLTLRYWGFLAGGLFFFFLMEVTGCRGIQVTFFKTSSNPFSTFNGTYQMDWGYSSPS